jgi:hypothetical protein
VEIKKIKVPPKNFFVNLFDKATGNERMTEIEVEEERYIKEVVWKHKEVYTDLFDIDDYITL